MSDRVPSDHDAVSTHRVHLEAVGRTGRLRVPLPTVVTVAPGDDVVVSLEGDSFDARVEATVDAGPAVTRAADTPRRLRTGDGENRLTAWFDEIEASVGDPVLIDVVTRGYKLGLRRPGERVVYTATDPPRDSLADIARNLDE